MNSAHRVVAALGVAFTLAAAAVAAAMPAQAAAPAGSVSYQNPAIVWTGNAVLVAATDSSGNLDYWWQASGTGVWNEQQVAAATSTLTYSNPAIVWTGNAVLVTATDSAGNVDYWWQASGTGVWHEQQVAAATSTLTYLNPAIVWTGNAVLVTASDSAGNVDYWWQASGTGVWHPQQVAAATSSVTYQKPAMVWTGNAVLVTAADSGGNVDYWWQASGTGVWNPEHVAAAGGGLTYQEPAITWTGSAVLVTAADSAGDLNYWSQAVGTGAWNLGVIAAEGVPWGDAIEIPGTPGGPNVLTLAQVNSVSCASVGNCAAAGQYHTSNGYEAFVADEVSGTWGGPMEVPGTVALNVGGDAFVSSVSCGSAGNCAAGGQYLGSAGREAFLADEVDGTWGDAMEVPGTAALNAGEAQVTSVSCPTAGNCAAVGYYFNVSTGEQVFVADEVNGTWDDAIEVPGTAALNAGVSLIPGLTTSVSCGSAGNCSAAGQYVDKSGNSQAFVADEVDGTWGEAIEVPGSATLNAGGESFVNSVSCASAGNCAVGGFYYNNSSGVATDHAFVVDEADGIWGDAIEVSGSALSASGDAEVTSVSCGSAGNCAAAGEYLVSSTSDTSSEAAFVVNEVNGTWGEAIEVPGTGVGAEVTSLSCPSAGDCGAGGTYYAGISGTQAFVVSEVNGTWGEAAGVPGIAALSDGGEAWLASVSCSQAAGCAAGGYYEPANSGLDQAFVVSQN
jgi:hypothetical protein